VEDIVDTAVCVQVSSYRTFLG